MDLLSSSDWASLPINLLDWILDYLAPIDDYFTVSEVCIEWKHAVREKLQHLRSNHKRHCRLHQQVPLLMVLTTDDTRNRCCLCDVLKGKRLGEVQFRQWRCEGSSYGWLILVDEYDPCKVTLVDLFSGKQIHLPPLKKAISIFSFKPWMGNPRRGVLFIDSDVRRGEFVVTMMCRAKTIAFIKSGEEDWTYIKELGDVEDVAYSNGFFYALDERGVLSSCDVSNGYKVRRITSGENDPCCALVSPLVKPPKEYLSYLVESPEGDLLRVVKPIYELGGFVIYKLVWFSSNPRWEEVVSLGDVALFLGVDSRSISVIASDFAGCRPNSIYYCESSDFFNWSDGSVSVFSGRVNVFSLNDRTIKTPHYPYFLKTLFWLSP